MEDGQMDPGHKPQHRDHDIQPQHSPFVEEAWIGCAIAAGDLQRWVEEKIGHREETEGRDGDHDDELVGADGMHGVRNVPVRHCIGTDVSDCQRRRAQNQITYRSR